MSTVKIALTGGISSGKSQISDLLANIGYAIIDTDVIAREVVKPNTIALSELVKEFSNKILNKNGELDRKYLRGILFKDKKNKEKIENIIQPKIYQRMHQLIDKSDKDIVIVVIPLLIEKDLYKLFDKFIVIDCDERTQIQRLKNRDKITEKQANNIIKQQISRKKRLDFAKDKKAFLIDNNKDIEYLEQQIKIDFKEFINE